MVGWHVPLRDPPARVDHLVEPLHGVPVADPYRWLEDADSPEPRAWVDAQKALTRSMLDGPQRGAVVGELTALFNCPRTTTFVRRGHRYFVVHNPGLLNQPRLYVQADERGLRPGAGRAQVLLDPNQLAADGTTALTPIEPSPDGRRLAYGLSQDGSDREVLRVR